MERGLGCPKLNAPVCGGEISLAEDVMPGEVIEHDCGVVLEIIIDNGRILLKPLEVGEDWGE